MTILHITRRTLLTGMAAIFAGTVSSRAAESPTTDEVAFDPDLPVLGNPDGTVTIAEFADFQCPSCKYCYGEVRKVLADDPDLRFVLRDWPIFGDRSRDAARLVLATAAQGNYAVAIDALMANKGGVSKRRTAGLLRDAGVDVDRAEHDLVEREAAIDALLTRNETLAKAFQLQGTPGFVVGAKLFRRGLHARDLKVAIAEARAASSRNSDASASTF